MNTPPGRIELHIDALVLHGFAADNRDAIGQALQAELSRILVEHGLPSLLAHSAEIPAIATQPYGAPAGAKPSQVGAKVAQAIYEGLKR